jgi:hypothetical protein
VHREYGNYTRNFPQNHKVALFACQAEFALTEEKPLTEFSVAYFVFLNSKYTTY